MWRFKFRPDTATKPRQTEEHLAKLINTPKVLASCSPGFALKPWVKE
jgi:hypothetical protein